MSQLDSLNSIGTDSIPSFVMKDDGDTPPPLPPSILLHLEKSGCYGSCPNYTIDLYSNGLVVLKGKAHLDYIGTYEYQVKPNFIQQIEQLVNQADFYTLHDRYPKQGQPLSDLPTTILRAHFGQQLHTVNSNYGRPQRLRALESKLEKKLFNLPFRAVENATINP